MKQKKSQAHIEVILSFVIFVGFVFAIFIFINPLRQENINPVSFERVQSKILANLSVQYNQASLIINQQIPDGCFSVADSINAGNNFIIRNSTSYLKSNKNNGNFNIENSGNERFYYIYFSDTFNSRSLSDNCASLDAGNYSFGVLNTQSSVLYENIQSLNQSYLADYSGLKTNLGIDGDFNFIVYDINRNVLFGESVLKHKPLTGNVISRDIPLKAIDKNANKVDIIESSCLVEYKYPECNN